MADQQQPADNAKSGSDTGKRVKSGIAAFGRSMQEQGQQMMRDSEEASQRAITQREGDPGLEQRQMASPSSYRRGGKVRKGGLARVHAGEVVLTKKRAKKLRKKLRGSKGRM